MVATSNIHVGIAGWSNATYSVGQRRSNAGNAYQVITAGTSTAPPTGTGSNIAPGGTSHWKWLSAIDYTTWQAHYTAIPGTLTQPVVGLLWNDATITATLATSILDMSAGKVTTVTNTITYQPAPGEGWLDTYTAAPTTAYAYNSANGVAIQMPASGAGGVNYVQVNDNWVIFRGLQFKDPNSGSNSTMLGGAGANCVLSQCIFDGYSQTGGADIISLFSTTNLTIKNCLIIDRAVSGAPTIGVQGTTGCIIVNNTIVLVTPAGTSVCLDCATATTSGVNKAVNNIFINYEQPFRASSGTPWTTNHNAFTLASFNAIIAENGTDTGGSVYGITASGTFVNAATDFHAKAGAAVLNAGLTDTADIPEATDAFGVSRPQGANWDIGAHELLAGSVILRDFVVPAAFGKQVPILPGLPNPWSSDFSSDFGGGSSTGQPDPVIAIEWTRQHQQNMVARIEWRGVSPSVNADTTFVIDILASWPANLNPWSSDFSADFGGGTWTAPPVPVVPIEWRLSITNMARDVAIPLEWRSTPFRDLPVATDWRGLWQVDKTASIDWSTPLNGVNYIMPVSFGRSVIEDATINADWSRQHELRYALPVEWLGAAGVIADRPVPIEWGFVPFVFGAAAVPIEWLGFTAVVANQPTPIEWGASRTQDTSAPIENNRTHIQSHIGPVAWTASTLLDSTAPAAWTAGILTDQVLLTDWRVATVTVDSRVVLEWGLTRQADGVSSTGWGVTVSADLLAPMSYTLILARDDTVPSEFSGTRIRDALIPLDIGGGRGSMADVPVALEWRGGILADTPMATDTGGAVMADGLAPLAMNAGRSADYVLGAAWLASPIGDAAIQAEWGHLTLSVARDDRFALEMLQTVVTSVTVTFSLDVGRESIGASIEPDEWECEHEP